MVVLKIIGWIVAISALVGLIAAVVDLGKPKNGHKPYGPYEAYVKRGLDAFLATGALIVLSPVMIVVAVLVRVKLGRPVFFSQERPGLNENLFRINKYRTMTDKRDSEGKLLPDSERLTKFGKVLRSTSLDEIPELINIAKGDMAIVGPRPLLTQYLPYYRPEERARHSVRPGLTGYAQIHGRNYIMWDERVALDVKYAKKITFFGDLKIIMQTIIKVIKRADVAEKRIPPLDQVRQKELEKAEKR